MLASSQIRSFLRAENIQVVEIPITSASVYKYNFPIIGNLIGKPIVAIEAPKLNFASPNNVQIIAGATVGRTYVTLVNKLDRTQITRVALYSLLVNPGTIKQLNFTEVDWENSFIEIANDPAAPVAAPAGRAILFAIHYTERNSPSMLTGLINQFTELLSRM